MGFEYDPEKSVSNAQKHGIEFDKAQQLWSDTDLLILPSRFRDEPRFLAIGSIERKIWTAIFTERRDQIRLISVRGARKEEMNLYEQNKS